MRKLMWFAMGVLLAAWLRAYWIPSVYYMLAAGICAVLLMGCVLLLFSCRKSRFAVALVLGCLAGFLWQTGYDGLYLSVPKAADETKAPYVIHACDYSFETDNGSVVNGYIILNQKPYRVKVYLPAGVSAAPGDRISGYFSLSCTLPGKSADSSYDRSDGIYLVASPMAFTKVEEAESLPWYGIPAAIRQRLNNMIEAVLPEDVYALAKGLLLGDTDELTYKADTDLSISGIRHIVAVSGLHVSILFSMIYMISGRKRWISALLGIPVLVLFAAIVGFSPSITRACIMHSMLVIGALVNREYDSPTALSFAVLCMLTANPWTAASVSFQLSVGCIAGILLFAGPVQGWLMDKKRLGRFRGFPAKICTWFSASVSVSIGAAIITTPLCAYYFGVVSLVSVLTNLLSLWVIAFVFYGILLSVLIGLISMPLAAGIAWLVAWPMRYVLWICGILAAFPFGAVYTQSKFVVGWLVLSYLLLLLYYCIGQRRGLLQSGINFLALCLALILSWTEPLKYECRVTVLDVGQGQCILLQSDGKNFLVDCGGDSDAYAADQALHLLLSQGIYRLDGLILTHYDADHAAGAVHLLDRIPADVLYLPECLDDAGYRDILTEYEQGQVCMVTQDLKLTYAGTEVLLIPSEFGQTDNESGLCILFQTETCDILITGDRGISGEAELMRRVALPELEVLVVGHHGSRHSTGEALLEVTKPEIAIISVSEDNIYGHPADEVLERLEAYGCVVYRTDEDGTVIFWR